MFELSYLVGYFKILTQVRVPKLVIFKVMVKYDGITCNE